MSDEVSARKGSQGPFRADQLQSKDPYELSEGHAIFCPPTKGDGGRGTLTGAHVLDTDPGVDSAGVEVGHELAPNTLRSPDISVGSVPDAPDWVSGAPPLAVEYAGSGQNETELREKIRELLDGGARWVWVVRLKPPRRVEVHEAGVAMRVFRVGDVLEAPGVLKNRVPVEALFDRTVSLELTLRNLLQRKGYEGFDDLVERTLERGRLGALRDGIRELLQARGVDLSSEEQVTLAACGEEATLFTWLRRAATATRSDDLFS